MWYDLGLLFGCTKQLTYNNFTEAVIFRRRNKMEISGEVDPNNNYVRINDLRTIIEEVARAEICIAFAAGHHKMQDKLTKVPPPNGLTNSNWGEENKEG